MADLSGIDLTSGGFRPLPAGRYKAVIISSERRRSKSGKGDHLAIEFHVTEGEYKNRTVRAWLNLWHTNPVTVEIAKSTLAAICHAVGVQSPGRTEVLHNRPLMIEIGFKKHSETGELENVVTRYSQVDPSAPGNGAFPGTSAPWMR